LDIFTVKSFFTLPPQKLMDRRTCAVGKWLILNIDDTSLVLLVYMRR